MGFSFFVSSAFKVGDSAFFIQTFHFVFALSHSPVCVFTSLSLNYSLPLFLSRTHTHTHTHSLSLSHTLSLYDSGYCLSFNIVCGLFVLTHNIFFFSETTLSDTGHATRGHCNCVCSPLRPDRVFPPDIAHGSWCHTQLQRAWLPPAFGGASIVWGESVRVDCCVLLQSLENTYHNFPTPSPSDPGTFSFGLSSTMMWRICAAATESTYAKEILVVKQGQN